MAVYIDTRHMPQKAPTFGESLGSGLVSQLEYILSQKIKDLRQQKERSQTAMALQSLGYQKEDAQKLSLFHPTLLGHVITNKYSQEKETRTRNEAERVRQEITPKVRARLWEESNHNEPEFQKLLAHAQYADTATPSGKGQALSDEQAQLFLVKAKGDKNLAAKLAQQAGFIIGS